MDYIDAFVLIVGIIGWGTSIMILRQSFYWKNKHDDAVSAWTIESRNKDKQLEKLENEIKTYKDMERVIKVEKVIMQPREIECKFMLHERFVDDTELFKKVITSEVARYIAEELEKDPYLCKVYHENSIYDQERIKVKFRMLPYAEGVVWDDIFKEEEDRQELDKTLGTIKCGMGWDKINRLGDYYNKEEEE